MFQVRSWTRTRDQNLAPGRVCTSRVCRRPGFTQIHCRDGRVDHSDQLQLLQDIIRACQIDAAIVEVHVGCSKFVPVGSARLQPITAFVGQSDDAAATVHGKKRDKLDDEAIYVVDKDLNVEDACPPEPTGSAPTGVAEVGAVVEQLSDGEGKCEAAHAGLIIPACQAPVRDRPRAVGDVKRCSEPNAHVQWLDIVQAAEIACESPDELEALVRAVQGVR
jgi:hypothetical protein